MLARFFSLVLILICIFFLSRGLIRLLPGDPLDVILGDTATKIPAAEIKKDLGLDQPFWIAARQDLKRLVINADLGYSLTTREPIWPALQNRLFSTLILTLTAVSLGIFFSLVIGLLSQTSRFFDELCTWYSGVASALPTPWIGPILIYFFSVLIPLFPPQNHIALPALTLALVFSGGWSRLIRQRVRESIRVGSASGARARGIPEWKILLKYGLAPVSGALIGFLGTQVGVLLGGTFITEVIFGWPGMGTYFVDAVLSRDYTVVEAAAFVGAATSLIGTALGDVAKKRFEVREGANT